MEENAKKIHSWKNTELFLSSIKVKEETRHERRAVEQLIKKKRDGDDEDYDDITGRKRPRTGK